MRTERVKLLDIYRLLSYTYSMARPPTALSANQQRHVSRVASRGQKLADAKAAALAATEEVKDAVFDALDAGVPLARVARAAGLQRSVVYKWREGGEE